MAARVHPHDDFEPRSISRPSAPALREKPHLIPFAICQSCLLRATPSLDLTLRRNCISDAIEMFGPDQGYRAARPCVAVGKRARVVLVDARRKVVTGRASHVKRSVGATQHVDERTHGSRTRAPRPIILRGSAFGRAPQDDGADSLEGGLPHSILMPAAFTTAAHLGASAASR